MSLESDWKEIRRVATPWCAVRTSDYRATIRSLMKWAGEKVAGAVWTCTNGCTTPVEDEDGQRLGVGAPDLGNEEVPPATVLKNAISLLPENGVLFLVLPDDEALANSFVIQGIADVRDAFKRNRRTLVILGTNPKLPPFLSEDIPVLDDPLPTRGELSTLAATIARESMKLKLDDDLCGRAAESCLGMTRFAAEEAIARKLRKDGIDLPGLAEARRLVVEEATNKALTFEREKWTFNQVGGQESFKAFMGAIAKGPKRPSLIVRVDEIDKSITAASGGQVADNTGVSQDILKCLLTSVEDNKWMGLLAVGGPGVGKTLSSVCTGNTFDIRTLALDLGAVKGSLVGESEGKIRRVMDVLKSIGGENVLFMATANRLDTLPPELQRRFWLGTWFWDLPTAEGRRAIWKIQRARFNIPAADKTPDDNEWTGSDVRNACQMAFVCGSSLAEAAERITIAGKTSATQIEALRALAEKSGFRSASRPGAYKRLAESSNGKRRAASL